MCGMGGVGAHAPMTNPALSLASQPQVAGATGGGQTTSALPTGQADLGAVLLQLTKALEALVQALAGAGAIGGGPGQLPPVATDAPTQTTDAPPAKTPQTYTVKQGDTLSKIAKAHGITPWQALYEANKDVIGDDPNRIFPGQVLTLPDGATPTQTPPNPAQGGGTAKPKPPKPPVSTPPASTPPASTPPATPPTAPTTPTAPVTPPPVTPPPAGGSNGAPTTSTAPSGVVGSSGGVTYNGRKYVVGDFIGPITNDTTRLPGLQRGGRIYPAGFIGPIDSKSVRLPG